MEFRLAMAAACAAVLVGAAPVRAATYNWSYSSNGHGGSGQLTTTDSGSPYTITAINGVFDEWNIDGLISCCGSPPANQLLYAAPGPFLDNLGLAFSTAEADGTNIFYFEGGYVMQDTNQNFVQGGSFTVTLVPGPQLPVPEPASPHLVVAGLAGLFLCRRWRQPAPEQGAA